MSAIRASALGTQVRLPDGRVGTVVFNSLFGVGIKWGLHDPSPSDFEGTDGNTVAEPNLPEDWPWKPDALLRVPWRGPFFEGMECVGDDFEITRHGLGSEE